MDNQRVFFCDVDYLYTKESKEFETLAGGAVYVFVRAFDVREALSVLVDDLKSHHMEPKEIVSISPYNVEQEWANEEERTHYLHLYVECEKVNAVVYDDFMAYEKASV
jgi:hypothetical protein